MSRNLKKRNQDTSIQDILKPIKSLNSDMINIINSSEEAIQMIKDFYMSGGDFIYNDKIEYSEYDSNRHEIVLGKQATAKTIFHELGHAIGVNHIKKEEIYNYKTANDASKAFMKTEGEAIYYERKIVKILKEISEKIKDNINLEKDAITKNTFLTKKRKSRRV